MPLTDVKVRTAKPQDKPYKLADGGGLYLLVNTNGSRYWRLKYRVMGREKLLSIGVYPDISLAVARQKRDEARNVLAEGNDPSALKKAEKQAKKIVAENTFESIAREWHKAKEGANKSKM